MRRKRFSDRSIGAHRFGRGVAAAGIMVAVLSLAPAVGAQSIPITEMTPDARADGMGRAFTAVAEGPAACFWNPAVLSRLEGIWISPYGHALIDPFHHLGADLDAVGVAWGRRGWGLGAHWNRLESGSRKDGNGRWRESSLQVGAGRAVLRRGGADVGVGLNLKWIRSDYTPYLATSPALEGRGWDADLGLLASQRWALGAASTPDRGGEASRPWHQVRGGIQVRAVQNRDVHYSGQDKRILGGSATDPIGRVLRVGAAYELVLPPLPSVPQLGPVLRLLISGDLEDDLNADAKWIRYFGAEVTAWGFASGRWGYIYDRNGNIRDSTRGYGIGADLDLDANGWLRGCGFRLDSARLPTARELDYSYSRTTFSFWVRTRA